MVEMQDGYEEAARCKDHEGESGGAPICDPISRTQLDPLEDSYQVDRSEVHAITSTGETM